MNQIVKLNNKFACANCGNKAEVTERKCGFCNKPFDEKIKVIDIRPFHKKTREEITRIKIRRNQPLVLNDFISVRKLMELRKISVMI